jgi:hypothetical protein
MKKFMTTSLKVSDKLLDKLKAISGEGETYEDTIWRLIGSRKEGEQKLANEEEEKVKDRRRARKATIVKESKWRPVDDVL